MSKAQRLKGDNGERELCGLLADALGEEVTRNLGQARDSGHDITISPFAIEVKRRARIGHIYEWMEQCKQSTTATNKIPVVAFRSDRQGWMVTMRLQDWIAIAREEMSNS